MCQSCKRTGFMTATDNENRTHAFRCHCDLPDKLKLSTQIPAWRPEFSKKYKLDCAPTPIHKMPFTPPDTKKMAANDKSEIDNYDDLPF